MFTTLRQATGWAAQHRLWLVALLALLILPVIAVPRTGAATAALAVDAEKAAIRDVLDGYVRAVATEDMDLYGQAVAHDPAMVNFGTGAEERIVGWAALQEMMNAQNEALSNTSITQRDVTINVAPDGQFAWATSLWDLSATVGEDKIEVPIRCTWVLQKGDYGWEIIHFHKSVGTTG